MAKYVIPLVLLVCLALENDNIYNRLHAHSHPGAIEETEGGGGMHMIRQHQKQAHRHATKHHALSQHTQHKRHHHARHAIDVMQAVPNEKDDGAANPRLRRHMRHQRERRLEQLLSYNRFDAAQLQQYLRGGYASEESAMLADAPDSSSQESSFGNNNLDPLSVVEQELAKNNWRGELPPIVEEDEQQKEMNTNTTKTSSSSKCPKCESTRQVEHITEEELTRLRIDFVKQQILEKLRLKESPNVSATNLPRPIFDGVTLSHPNEGVKNKELDDYYARTSKKFIFLKQEHRECKRLGAHPSICFSFKIEDADADSFDVSTAVLWLYKNKQNHTRPSNESELTRRQIVVSELEQQLDEKYLPLAKTIAIQSVDVQDAWMKIDIEWPIKRWFGNHDLSHLIQISCDSCDISSMEEMISVDKDYRPFIMIDAQNRRSKPRQKRSINCSPGVTECCREKLYISFKDIGWDNWIVQPRGYDAYFCRGSCGSVASVTQTASHHSSLMKILSTNGTHKPLELIPCCTAKQYSSLQLVVMDSNNSATVKTLPNMVVESCGCR